MARPPPEFVVTMIAGVRLVQVGAANRPIRYAITTLRSAGRLEFGSLGEARAAFDAEVEASRGDPVVGPYVC